MKSQAPAARPRGPRSRRAHQAGPEVVVHPADDEADDGEEEGEDEKPTVARGAEDCHRRSPAVDRGAPLTLLNEDQ